MIITILIVLFIIFIISIQEVDEVKQNKNVTGYKQMKKSSDPKPARIPTVQSLVKSVKTYDDIKAFEIKSEEYLVKFQESGYENNRYEKLHYNYIDACHQAGEVTLFYQFSPSIDLYTPQEIIDLAYEIIEVKDYTMRKKKTLFDWRDEWDPITIHDFNDDGQFKEYILKKPDYWNSLIKYGHIVDGEGSYVLKRKLINKLVESDHSFSKEFFYHLGRDEEPSDYWMKGVLECYDVPIIDKLYDLGYDTPEKVSKIDLKEIIEMKGFGAKKLEQLKKAIKLIKKHNASIRF